MNASVKVREVRPLRIAILAPFEEAVPPITYGGTELIVSSLTEELVRRGHDVSLFSAGGSKTSAKLYPIYDQPLRQKRLIAQIPEILSAHKSLGVAQLLNVLGGMQFDVIHSHISARLIPYHQLLNSPVVTTIHHPLNNLTLAKYGNLHAAFPKEPYISISYAQRKPLPNLNYVANIYNGIDVDAFDFESNPQDYYAFLARFSPEKGPLQAIQIAKKLGKKLIMAAKIGEKDSTYYEQYIKPHIDGKQIVYMGEADHPQKVELLKNAQALLAPIQWDEPFGLYFIEAMACGTPVLTINRGSAPEIIRHEQTGFLGKDEEELVEMATGINGLDRKFIRTYTKSHFSVEIMVDNYENTLYNIAAEAQKQSITTEKA